MSVQAFKNALDALVNTAGAGRRGRARPNMAMTYDGIRFDSVDELLAYKKASRKGAKSGKPSKPVRPARVAGPAKVAGPSRSSTRAVSPSSKNPDGPVSRSQGETIGISVGRMAAYCPWAERALAEKVSHAQVLMDMGLETYGDAHRVLSAMDQAGVLRRHRGEPFDKAKAAAALRILIEVGGIQCPV